MPWKQRLRVPDEPSWRAVAGQPWQDGPDARSGGGHSTRRGRIVGMSVGGPFGAMNKEKTGSVGETRKRMIGGGQRVRPGRKGRHKRTVCIAANVTRKLVHKKRTASASSQLAERESGKQRRRRSLATAIGRKRRIEEW